ncbi:hypothetical protein V7075_13590 [Neobacillus drentensis]|uniref:hypothetical protein n=1 Tax=Neobacillus drentensis TaxID=220684 RepID=UPI002FFF6179
MTIDRFENEDDKQRYLDWRKRNPNGFVLNINTWNPKLTMYKNIIHRASGCSSLDTPPNINRDRPVTHEHPKLCSTDLNELVAEMENKDLPYKTCDLCKPKVN